ncbi:MAG: tetratricopeptide repeat protein [Acidobacteriota bacterium]
MRGLLFSLLFTVVAGAACTGADAPVQADGNAESGASSSADPPADQLALPQAVLEGLEPAVQQQLRQRHDAAQGAEDAEAWGSLARTYHAYDLMERALPAYRRAAALAPGDLRWTYYRGVLRQAAGEPQRAEKDLGSVADASALPPSVRLAARLRQGDALLDDARSEEAVEVFEQAREMAPPGSAAVAYALYGAGRGALEKGEGEEALRQLEAALALAPDSGRVRWSLGQAHLRFGERERARQLLAQAGPRPPAFEDPWMAEVAAQAVGSGAALRRGSLALLAGDVDGAVRQLQEAVATDPENRAALQSLGSALARQGRPQQALEPLRRAVELSPESVDPLLLLAAVQEQLGDWPAARRSLDGALEIAPENPQVELRRAQLELAAGEAGEALRRLDALLERSPDFSAARFQQAGALGQLGRFRQAAEAYSAVLEAEPGHLAARLGLATALGLDGEEEAAARVLEAGLEAVPGEPRLLHALARLLATASQKDLRDGPRAVGLAQRALEDEPTLERGETLALAHAAAAQWAPALQWQERVVGELERRSAAGDAAAARALPQARDRLVRWRQEVGG